MPFLGKDSYDAKQIEDYLRTRDRSESAMTFIKVVEAIRGLLETGGGLVEGTLKGFSALARAIRVGEDVTLEGVIPTREVDRIFDIWKDIMAAHGVEIYLKVRGHDHTRSVWRECVDGRWVTMREDIASPSEIRYEYVGAIAKATEEEMREELDRILAKESARLLKQQSLSEAKVNIKVEEVE